MFGVMALNDSGIYMVLSTGLYDDLYKQLEPTRKLYKDKGEVKLITIAQAEYEAVKEDFDKLQEKLGSYFRG